jgi:SAM-dependent methyltransferase
MYQQFQNLYSNLKKKVSRKVISIPPIISTISISMVRNEQDIIEPFLRHHAALFDLMIVLDNCSSDSTRSLLAKTARQLGNVVMVDWPDSGYNQSETMTTALRCIQTVVFADFVFFLDADEFVAVYDKADLHSKLAEIPVGHIALLPWITIVPNPELDENLQPDPLLRMNMRRSYEKPQYYKAVIRMGGRVNSNLIVEKGNHLIKLKDEKQIPSKILKEVPLLHFPVRSSNQMYAKGVNGWRANIARRNRKEDNAALQWKHLHDAYFNGKIVDPLELTQIALNYAQAISGDDVGVEALPFNHGIIVKRQFSDGRYADAKKLIDLAERQLHEGMYDQFVLPNRPEKYRDNSDVPHAFAGTWHWEFMFLDEPPIRSVIEMFQPRSILDLGCGNGVYPLLYKHLGVEDVLGVDGIELGATVLSPKNYQKIDLEKPYDAGRKFDLVICLEVVEHLTPTATATMFETISSHANVDGHILFSVAEPGQPGNGHINCLETHFVLEQWKSLGWEVNLPMTLGLRAISSMQWFRRNLLLLERSGSGSQNYSNTGLIAIAALKQSWREQPTGQHRFAFMEPNY